jgi:predicted DNA-binding protein
MNIELSEDVRQRVEYFAKIFNKTPAEYLSAVIECAVPQIPNQAAAVQHLQDVLDGKYANGEEDDLDDYVRRLNDARLHFPISRPTDAESAKS